MPLPILKTSFASHETLIRYFHKTELEWSRHLGEETQLDVGTAIHNPQLPNTWMANRILEAQLPVNISADAAMRMVQDHFTQHGSTCWQWIMNPSADPAHVAPLVEHLLANGHTRESADIMHMEQLPANAIAVRAEGLTIIPARASFKHARQLMEEWSAQWSTPELADAAMMHLDDPHYDALLALKDGVPVAHVGVLAIGEIGLVEQVYVASAFRGQGIATTMMSRAVEICARSLFKHIFLTVAPGNNPALKVYQKFGFRKIGECVAYQKEP